ncbi:hypothetical protein DL546_008776 [Coniochaeta pulveracea]|uniref:Uncharacterized protein n=1 Tax=Coniochaeta pulveracea TaxID=177199 RepID=A0A420YJ21_9PEZI|nr:hypothetical protein DL546_008776 [Coniochaeta pulveracea]
MQAFDGELVYCHADIDTYVSVLPKNIYKLIIEGHLRFPPSSLSAPSNTLQTTTNQTLHKKTTHTLNMSSLETLTFGEAIMMGLEALDRNQDVVFRTGVTASIAYVTVRAAARITRALNEWIERRRAAYEERRRRQEQQRYREEYYEEYEEYED